MIIIITIIIIIIIIKVIFDPCRTTVGENSHITQYHNLATFCKN